MTMHDAVRDEIEAVHAFFVAWFSGASPREDAVFQEGYGRHFSDDFILIPPAGTRLTKADLGGNLERGHASNPEFRVQIRNVAVRFETPQLVVATYEEWQRNAKASTPPDNGRVATVIFTPVRDEHGAVTLRWEHVHETWLPAATMQAGPFDF